MSRPPDPGRRKVLGSTSSRPLGSPTPSSTTTPLNKSIRARVDLSTLSPQTTPNGWSPSASTTAGRTAGYTTPTMGATARIRTTTNESGTNSGPSTPINSPFVSRGVSAVNALGRSTLSPSVQNPAGARPRSPIRSRSPQQRNGFDAPQARASTSQPCTPSTELRGQSQPFPHTISHLPESVSVRSKLNSPTMKNLLQTSNSSSTITSLSAHTNAPTLSSSPSNTSSTSSPLTSPNLVAATSFDEKFSLDKFERPARNRKFSSTNLYDEKLLPPINIPTNDVTLPKLSQPIRSAAHSRPPLSNSASSSNLRTRTNSTRTAPKHARSHSASSTAADEIQSTAGWNTGKPVGVVSCATPRSSSETDAKIERKIADLEITNSSLLTINSQLERLKLKQQTEIRELRKRLRESNNSFVGLNKISSPKIERGTFFAPFSPALAGEGTSSHTQSDSELDEDEEDEMTWEELMTRDEPFRAIATCLENLLRKGNLALQREETVKEGVGRVLSAVEIEERDQPAKGVPELVARRSR